ncbi:MAG: alpha/beta fold hydrolase [Pseudomonadota bacterium]
MTQVAEPFSFVSDGTTLAGTVTRPDTQLPAGAVLLLSGSGPQDRDETFGGHKPFAVLASELAVRGWLVLRWDDRGVDASGGDYLAANADQLGRDVLAALTGLETTYGALPLFLAGHSQGTLIAAAVAAKHPDRLAGVALFAGMATPGREGLLQQHLDVCRAEDLPEVVTESLLQFKRTAFDALSAAQADINAGADAEYRLANLRRVLLSLWLDGQNLVTLDAETRAQTEAAVDDLMEWEWRYLIDVQPAKHLSQLQCPVFAAFGGRDVQVAAAANETALRRALADGIDVPSTIHLLPDYNHLFQVDKNNDVLRYEALGTPFAAPVPDLLAQWLAETIA